MLIVEDLRVEVGGKEILHHIDLEIPPGEVHVILGPNGSGKTSLLMTIMGFPNYRVLGGKIWFQGQDITGLPIYERARLGIGISFQRPPTIRGIKTRQLVEVCARNEVDVKELAKDLDLVDFLERDINDGFSGGEIKRSELLQLLAQRPELVLLDEPESGVDLENITLIGEVINRLLERGLEPSEGMSRLEAQEARTKLGLIITHTGHILNYVDADRGHLLYDGRLCCEANPRELLKHISETGYEECVKCMMRAMRGASNG